MNTSQEDIPLKDLINLSDKNAIVTGGATGIGSSIVRRLAEADANVLIADIDNVLLKRHLKLLMKRGIIHHFSDVISAAKKTCRT